MTISVAILAGGLATRLRPITERIPKSLVEVAGKPFAAHQVELLRRHGLTDIVFLVGHLGEMLRDVLGDGPGLGLGVRLRYVFDGSRALGTGGAIQHALPMLSDPFFVLYGDSYLDCDYRGIEKTFLASTKNGLMTVYRNEDQWDRSNVLFEGGSIVRYDKQRTPDMRHIDYGLGIFRKVVFSEYSGASADGVFDLAAVYQDLIAQNDLAGFEAANRFYEIGSPAGLEETRAHLSTKGAAAR